MEKVFEIDSFASSEAAWHQELSFDEPYKVRVVIENLGSDPIYGFYLCDEDFQFMIDNGGVNDDILARIQKQLLCKNEKGTTEIDVEFPTGNSTCASNSMPNPRPTRAAVSLSSVYSKSNSRKRLAVSC